MILSIIVLLILVLDGTYWARYIPYVYIIPFIPIVSLLNENSKKYEKIIAIILTIFLVCNSLLVLKVQYNQIKNNNIYVQNHLTEFRKYSEQVDEVNIKLNHNGLQGILYNLDDIKVTNKIVVTNDESLNREGFFFKY